VQKIVIENMTEIGIEQTRQTTFHYAENSDWNLYETNMAFQCNRFHCADFRDRNPD